MRKLRSHLLFLLFTFLVGFSVLAKPAEASVLDWLKAQFNAKESSQNMNTSLTQEGVSSEKHVTETTSNLMGVINMHVLGPSTDPNASEEEEEEASLLRQSIGPGLINTVNSGIVAMYDPPASAQTYVADVLQHAKIIPEAQAQGLGFASLDPILETWKAFRNLAYLFFVVIFLVIGFMIMFRSKIGQAAITVQQAIPSIIVALLAVTFSYAIAGFLIDLMYVMMYMLAGLFNNVGTEIIEKNIFQIIPILLDGMGRDVQGAVKNLMDGFLNNTIFADAKAINWLSGLSATVILGIAILISTFKIFLELLKSYVAIILQVVFAPITLMMGAIPGKNVFAGWIKNMVGNLLMWPIFLVCILVNRMLTSDVWSYREGSSIETGGFMPPFLLGSGQGEVFPVIVGIGILLVIPEIMKEAKKKLGVEEGIMGSLAGSAWDRIQKGWKGTEIIPGKKWSNFGSKRIVEAPFKLGKYGVTQAINRIETGGLRALAPQVLQETIPSPIPDNFIPGQTQNIPDNRTPRSETPKDLLIDPVNISLPSVQIPTDTDDSSKNQNIPEF